MQIKLFNKDQTFFNLFNQQVSIIVEASRLLHEMSRHWPDTEGRVQKMVELEDRGDAHARVLIEHLNKSFVTPMDREDIHSMAVLMDDILDLFQSVSVRMQRYEMKQMHPAVEGMATVLLECADTLNTGVAGLARMENISHLFPVMQDLENRGDDVNRDAIAELYRNCKTVEDTVLLMQWKDIIGRLEDAVDKFKKTFEMLQQVIIKNA